MEENLDEILSDENSGAAPLPSGDEAYLLILNTFSSPLSEVSYNQPAPIFGIS